MPNLLHSGFLSGKCLFLALCFLALFNAPAYSAVDESGRKQLETVVNNIIGLYREKVEERGNTLVTEGELLVETNDDYYAITLPFIKIIHANDMHTDVGMIAVNAIPGDDPDSWKVTLAVPTPIIKYDTLDNPVTTVNIGSQNFMGVWNEKFRNFIKLNAAYKNVEINNKTQDFRVTIPEITLVNKIEEGEGGLWSGPSRIALTDFNLEGAAGKLKAHIDKVSIEGRIKDYSIDAVLDTEEKLSALEESYEADGAESTSASHVTGIYNLVFDELSEALDGFTGTVRMQGLKMTKPPVALSPEGRLNLDTISATFGMGGFRTGSVDLEFDLRYDGLTFAPLPEEQKDVLPDHMTVDFQINRLPFRKMVELGRSSVKTAMQNPGSAQMTGIQALLILPKLATDAGTSVSFEDLSIGNDVYNLFLNAVLNADHNATKGFIGNGRMEIKGLDKLIEINNQGINNQELTAEQRAKIQQAVMVMTMLKGMGEKQANDVYVYDFSLSKDGKAMLNGQAMDGLIPGGQAPATQEEPLPAP